MVVDESTACLPVGLREDIVPLARNDRQHDMAGPLGIVEYGLVGHLHLQ